MPKQPKVAHNLVIRMLRSAVSKAANRSSRVKTDTHNHCLKPEVGHLLHSTKRFQCRDTFGGQTGKAPEGRETRNAAKTFPCNTLQ